MKLNKRWFIPLLLGFTLIVASYLRLYKIDEYMTFLGDEGRDVLRVKQMIVDGDLIFLGPTASVGGFFLGPMYYYFMTPFLWAWRLDPVGPAIMVAIFGIINVWLVYYVGKKWFHPTVGIAAAMLYALSPLVIAYTRSSWNPNLVPFFSLLLMLFLWRSAVFKRKTDLFIVGLIWGLGIQFHYLFSFVMVVSIIWIVLTRNIKLWITSFLAAIAGFAITFSPFLLFELKHSFPNSRSIINFIMKGNETGFVAQSFFQTVSDVLFRTFGRLLYRLPSGELWSSYPDWYMQWLFLLIRSTILISIGLLIVFVLSGLRNKRFSQYTSMFKNIQITSEQWYAALLMLLWFGFSVLLFGFYRRGIYDYYFGIFYAVPFLTMGLIFWQVVIRGKVAVVLSCLGLAALMYYNWEGRPFIYPPNKQMEQTKTIARAAVELAGSKPYNFALMTETNSDHAYRYFFEIWNKKPIKIETLEADPARNSVTEQLIVICEQSDCKPLGNSLWEIAGFGRAQVDQEKYVFPVKIFRLVKFTESAENSTTSD